MKRNLEIPKNFWLTLSPSETMEIFSTGKIQGDALARLWKLQGNEGKPPRALDVMINAEDLKREFPKGIFR